MRHILVSGLIVLSTVSSAFALDRYPAAKRYVNQTGQVIMIGNATQVAAIAEAPVRRNLPAVQIIPLAETAVLRRPALRLAPMETSARDGIFGAVNADPASWPSGRKCCRPGQPYFNEEPNS